MDYANSPDFAGVAWIFMFLVILNGLGLPKTGQNLPNFLQNVNLVKIFKMGSSTPSPEFDGNLRRRIVKHSHPGIGVKISPPGGVHDR